MTKKKKFKIGDLVEVKRDGTGEFLGYWGQVVEREGEDLGVAFTYNMVPLKGNNWGAWFEPSELEKVGND